MPVDIADVVDAVGVDTNTSEVVLTIADHLPWDGPAHLQLLEKKLNRYLGFIEHGELLAHYPDASGRSLRIDVVCRFEPSPSAVEFLVKARRTVEGYGSALSWRVHAA
jgi:hypothetical protein